MVCSVTRQRWYTMLWSHSYTHVYVWFCTYGLLFLVCSVTRQRFGVTRASPDSSPSGGLVYDQGEKGNLKCCFFSPWIITNIIFHPHSHHHHSVLLRVKQVIIDIGWLMKRRRCSVNYKTTLSTQTLSDHTHYTHFTWHCATFYILLTLEHQLKRQVCPDNVYQIVPGHQHHRLCGHGHHYTKPICQSISRATTSTLYIHHYTQRLLTVKVDLAPWPSHVLYSEKPTLRKVMS